MENLDAEIAKLEAKEFELRGLAATENYIPKKRKYLKRQNKINTKLSQLKSERKKEKNEKAKEALKQLLTNQRSFFKIEANGTQIEIPENLKLSIPFTPCGHTKKTYVAEVLRNGKQSNTWLLSTWRSLMQGDVVTFTTLNCEECRQEKAERKEKFGRIRATPIGTVQITIRHLH